MRARLGIALSVAGLLALAAWACLPVLRCLDGCYVDYVELFGFGTGNFALPDARLNSWILAWVQHSLLSDPSALFDGNVFHPARNTLASSEHMLGVALQTLPFRLLSTSAVFLHQVALVLSFPLLALTTFALVRWASGSTAAAFAAGATTLFMPWRHSEVPHLQLLSVQWLPLAWLLAARALLGDRPRRDALLLSGTLALQALSSFYLAYMSYLSLALLLGALLIQRGVARARLLVLLPALALPGVALAATALPYLSRFPAFDFPQPLALRTDPAHMWAFIAPSLALGADRARLAATTYYLPLVLFALALVPLLARWPLHLAGEPELLRLRRLAPALYAVALGGFAMMLGREASIGGTSFAMPGELFARFVPGFAQMRAEFRWAILVGLATPVLAGLGLALLTRAAAQRARRLGPAAVYATAGLLLAWNTPWFQLPARDAWERWDDVVAAHSALEKLPEGPLVELPWRLHRIHRARNGSAYMLASTRHWRPLLNGYSAYIPATHHFVQRIAQHLPDPDSADKLRRLTGLRWIVVHPQRLRRGEVEAWAAAERRGELSLAAEVPGARIYELPETPDTGVWSDALASHEARPETFTGLSRAPLELPPDPGVIEVRAPAVLRFELQQGLDDWARVAIENRTDAMWPGFDFQTEGLVLLRTRFEHEDGQRVFEDTWPLDTDVPPRATTVARVGIRPPPEAGRYRVRFDLVQEIGGALVPLAVPPVTRGLEVRERPPPRGPER